MWTYCLLGTHLQPFASFCINRFRPWKYSSFARWLDILSFAQKEHQRKCKAIASERLFSSQFQWTVFGWLLTEWHLGVLLAAFEGQLQFLCTCQQGSLSPSRSFLGTISKMPAPFSSLSITWLVILMYWLWPTHTMQQGSHLCYSWNYVINGVFKIWYESKHFITEKWGEEWKFAGWSTSFEIFTIYCFTNP